MVLGGSLNNRLRQDYGGTLVNDTDHTIKGGGTIEVGTTNKGTIVATSTSAPLMITANIANTGVLAAQGGSTGFWTCVPSSPAARSNPRTAPWNSGVLPHQH